MPSSRSSPAAPAEAVRDDVRRALREDVGAGDVSAGLLPGDAHAAAMVVAREECVLCGRDWFEEVFRACDERIAVRWLVAEGGSTTAGEAVCELEGPVRGLLSGERSGLNFLQLLSAVATQTRAMVKALEGSRAVLLDTRKTLPGLRQAQKYAVRVGGGSNHRMGLYDAVLLKENHIAAAGGVRQALQAARDRGGDLPVTVEVQGLDELVEALDAGADWIMLDNFSLERLSAAVRERDRRGRDVILEASGAIGPDNIAEVAATGVDRISVGALTKNVRACDFSMRLVG
ncbi:MAG: carboxylating nicotinate-nucleotide diphosphorylase [Gammaproteobacteria bacterium]|nr:carboxylating nicotinate-nucleotide diphosphorylase [Gammaproteobacteria bacterium]MYD02122.1 carboxylating nicotinate-nucleotide diphosphorylase [Gammaproteobacteria bacterium]MYI24587.1 carboxylating nicotinate-nucleotide diphosphorylase [Gammaproteobacteria bacterium]